MFYKTVFFKANHQLLYECNFNQNPCNKQYPCSIILFNYHNFERIIKRSFFI